MSAMIRIIVFAFGATLMTALQTAAQDAPVKVADRRRADALLKEHHPDNLRLLGIGGTVRLNIRVNSQGRPDSVEILSGSGIPSLDRAARTAVRGFTFSRPQSPVWLEMPLTFAANRKAATPFAELPQLSNRDAVLSATLTRLPYAVRRGTVPRP